MAGYLYTFYLKANTLPMVSIN